MSDPMQNPYPPAEAPVIESADEAAALCADIEATMTALTDVIEQESALVRQTRISETAELEARKSDLARRYVAEMKVVRAQRDHLAALAPDSMGRLRDLNDRFHAQLQINLAVLATAKAVAEDIVRGVSEAVGKRRRVTTYARDGRMAQAPRTTANAVTVDRSM